MYLEWQWILESLSRAPLLFIPGMLFRCYELVLDHFASAHPSVNFGIALAYP